MAATFTNAAEAMGRRVFCTNSLDMGTIGHIGFDLDFTLAEYKTDSYDELIFWLAVDALVKELKYPEMMRQIQFYRSFSLRGLWIDVQFGNILKVSDRNSILAAFHGHDRMNDEQIGSKYPDYFLKLNKGRIFVANTSYDAPVVAVYAGCVALLDRLASKKTDAGVELPNSWKVHYDKLFMDIQAAVTTIHVKGILHSKTTENLEKYLNKRPQLVALLRSIRATGRGTFLLTNSNYDYTNKILKYLTDRSDWHQLFNVTIVDAKKPDFFTSSQPFTSVKLETGKKEAFIRPDNVPLQISHVYSGGNVALLGKCTNIRGRSVLYVGDHIYGDILRSTKECGWTTFMVAPELVQELNTRAGLADAFRQLQNLEIQFGEIRANRTLTDIEPRTAAERNLALEISHVKNTIDTAFGQFGGMFSYSDGRTFFGGQIQKYATLYSSSCYNLANYSIGTYFCGSSHLLPHESGPPGGAVVGPPAGAAGEVMGE